MSRSRVSGFVGATVVLILLGFVFSDPLKAVVFDLLLRVGGVHANAEIDGASEEPYDDDEGRAVWFSSISYSFRTADGHFVRGISTGRGRLSDDLRETVRPIPTTVEYLPRYPHINRVRVSRELTSWWSLGLRVLLALLLLAGWAGLGISMFRTASKDTASFD